MEKILNYILTIFLLSLLGCQDYYVPELDLMPNALVVEGMITDIKSPVFVKLSRTIPFTDRTYFKGETNATVTLKSNIGDQVQLFETSPGKYQSKDSISGKPGVGYYLDITTFDNETYFSDIEIMMDPIQISEVQLTDSSNREIAFNYYGEPIVKNYPGIYFSVKPSTPLNPDVGFLYNWKSLINYMVITGRLPNQNFYYCWKQMNSRTLYVYDYNDKETLNKLLLDDIHFVSYYNISPNNLDSTDFKEEISGSYSTGFYYQIEQFTITQNGTKFWKSLKKQSEAGGKLFDPLEEEITTNIKCISNPDLKCFGFFNTASYSKRILRVDILGNSITKYEDNPIYPSPKISNDCQKFNVPDFWFERF